MAHGAGGRVFDNGFFGGGRGQFSVLFSEINRHPPLAAENFEMSGIARFREGGKCATGPEFRLKH